MKDVALVRRLLAVAETSHYPEEAAVARNHATRLMERLGITEADLLPPPTQQYIPAIVVGFATGATGTHHFYLRWYL